MSFSHYKCVHGVLWCIIDVDFVERVAVCLCLADERGILYTLSPCLSAFERKIKMEVIDVKM